MRSCTGPRFSPLGVAFVATLLVNSLLGADFSPRTHVYKRVNGLEIRADVHLPTTGAAPRPVVVYLHGGSLINGNRQSVEKWRPTSPLLEAGVVVVSLDYRLAPETKLPGVVADVEDGFRWVREQGPGLFGADPKRVAVAGSSAGGYLALVAATRVPGLRAVMAEMSYGDLLAEWQMRPSVHRPHYEDSNLSEAEAWRQVSGPPVANVRDRPGDGSAFNDFIRRTAQWPKAVTGWDPRTEAERYAPYLPVKHVTPAHPPTFLLHGRNDSDVPFSQPQAMAAEFARHGVKHRLVGIEGAEHGWRGVAAETVAAEQREGTEFLLDHLLRDRRSGALPPVETHVYKQVGDLQIRADVNRARRTDRAPVVIWLHGGGLMGGGRARDHAGERQLIDILLAAGISVVSIDYRLAPETKLPAIVEDVEDAFRWVRTRGPELLGIDPERIGVAGTSAGGYLALLAGCRVSPRPRAVVSFWGYGDIIAPWYSQPSSQARHHTVVVSEEEARRAVSGPPVSNAAERKGSHAAFYQYCRRQGLWPKAVTGWDPVVDAAKFLPYLPLRNVDSTFPPTFLIHGEADTDVPCEQSVLLAAELSRHGVEHKFIPVPGAEHGLKGSDPTLLPSLEREAAAFLLGHLKPATAVTAR